MPRTAKRKERGDIPWGRCATDEGMTLMAAIQNLDLQAVQTALATFLGDVNECKLYKSFTRSKEEEDAHSEAMPPLCVLAETEVAKQNDSSDSFPSQVVSEIANSLLKAGADPAVRGDYISGAFMSVKIGALETCRAILGHLKDQGKTVTCGASFIGQTRQNGTYGGNGTDVFYAAAKSNNPKMLPLVFEILKDELGPQDGHVYKSALGRLLDTACRYCSVSNAVFLLEQGASPEGIHFDKKEDWCDWQRPLHSASNQGNPDLVQALLDAGASINTRCVNGLSIVGGPIHFACHGIGGDGGGADSGHDKLDSIERRLETVRRLIKAGCDVNQPSVMERKTPLELAIQVGACDMIRFLIVEALCDTTAKDYERMARLHKKKAVGRAYERSIQERDESGGQSQPVKLRRVGEEEEEPEMIDFPLGGDAWTWDGEESIFPETVQFHPLLGLHNGEEQLKQLKDGHKTLLVEPSDSLEADDKEGQSESQQAVQLAKTLADAVKDEVLKSDGDSRWNPFWILATASSESFGGSADIKAAAKRTSRRSQRGGPAVEESVKALLQKLFGDNYNNAQEKITIETLDLSQLPDVLEVGKRSPALQAFTNALRLAGIDKAVSVILNGDVVFPRFVGCVVATDNQPSFVGVYATKVET